MNDITEEKNFAQRAFSAAAKKVDSFFGSPWYQIPFIAAFAICTGAAFIDNTQYMQMIDLIPVLSIASVIFGSFRSGVGLLFGMSCVSALGGGLFDVPLFADAWENIAAFKESELSIFNSLPQPQ